MERKESIGKDATSKEKLEDLEDNQAGVTNQADNNNPLSPDGALDDAEALKDADPE